MLPAALVVLLLADSAAPPVAAARAPITREQADSLARKIEALVVPAPAPKKGAPPRSVLFTEGEINSYLNLVLLPTVPQVRDVDLHITNGQLTATGLVDIDQVKKQLSLSPWNPVSFLKGRMAVNVSGHYANAGPAGLGRVTIDEVRAGSVPIPVSIIEQIVASSTRSPQLPDGVDIREPFRLPPPLRGLRLEAGKAFLDLL
jgi:hypothetical protein